MSSQANLSRNLWRNSTVIGAHKADESERRERRSGTLTDSEGCVRDSLGHVTLILTWTFGTDFLFLYKCNQLPTLWSLATCITAEFAQFTEDVTKEDYIDIIYKYSYVFKETKIRVIFSSFFFFFLFNHPTRLQQKKTMNHDLILQLWKNVRKLWKNTSSCAMFAFECCLVQTFCWMECAYDFRYEHA